MSAKILSNLSTVWSHIENNKELQQFLTNYEESLANASKIVDSRAFIQSAPTTAGSQQSALLSIPPVSEKIEAKVKQGGHFTQRHDIDIRSGLLGPHPAALNDIEIQLALPDLSALVDEVKP